MSVKFSARKENFEGTKKCTIVQFISVSKTYPFESTLKTGNIIRDSRNRRFRTELRSYKRHCTGIFEIVS